MHDNSDHRGDGRRHGAVRGGRPRQRPGTRTSALVVVVLRVAPAIEGWSRRTDEPWRRCALHLAG
ncbi:hypothetical protein NKG94_06760 [Micromonospora sp. M12]